MPKPFKPRLSAGLVALALALASTAGAARASEDHDAPLDLPPPPTPTATHTHEPAPALPVSRFLEGDIDREWVDGQVLSYRVDVTQTLQATGPYRADPVVSEMELELTESVAFENGNPVVTLEVARAEADGFLAEAEQDSARSRTIKYTVQPGALFFELKPGPDGEAPDLLDPETIAPFGDLAAVRMVDLALRAHLLSPVIPAEDYEIGTTFEDSAILPAGWTRGSQSLLGSVTVTGRDVVDGRRVVRAEAVHSSTDTLLRVIAMDNAVDALQGLEEPEPNDFFAGTIFDVLFPEGSTYDSLMPPLPLQATTEERRRPRPATRRRRRPGKGLALACLALTLLAACTDPARNPDVVSMNLSGPIQINHSSVIDERSGVLVNSHVNASARMAGKVHSIPEDVLPLLPEEIRAISGADVGLEAQWTITETLVGEPPGSSGSLGFGGAMPFAIALGIAAIGIVLVRRRKPAPAHRGTTGAPGAKDASPGQGPAEADRGSGED